jgi:hypothetical protein
MLYQLSYLADFHVKGVAVRRPFITTKPVTLPLTPTGGTMAHGPERRHAATSHTCIDSISRRSPAHLTLDPSFGCRNKKPPGCGGAVRHIAGAGFEPATFGL